MHGNATQFCGADGCKIGWVREQDNPTGKKQKKQTFLFLAEKYDS